VQVNEEGTEAAAATAVLMMRSAMRPQPEPEMRVDRPFLFAIWDRRTRAVLFVGQCADPQAAQA
jgi:serpin B